MQNALVPEATPGSAVGAAVTIVTLAASPPDPPDGAELYDMLSVSPVSAALIALPTISPVLLVWASPPAATPTLSPNSIRQHTIDRIIVPLNVLVGVMVNAPVVLATRMADPDRSRVGYVCPPKVTVNVPAVRPVTVQLTLYLRPATAAVGDASALTLPVVCFQPATQPPVQFVEVHPLALKNSMESVAVTPAGSPETG